MNEEYYIKLTQSPLFKGLDAKEIESLIEISEYKVVEFDKKEILTTEGERCKWADIILEGELSTKMESFSGKMVEVSKLFPGTIIAPAYLFAKEGRYPVTVYAETNVTVLRFTTSEFGKLLDKEQVLRWNFLRILSEITVFLASKMRILTLYTIREKVLHMLKILSVQQNSTTITLDKSRQSIAEEFGIQKFSLMRSLAALADEGIIEIDGKNIVILKPEQLIY